MNPKVTELRDKLTARIVESLDKDSPAWRQPWTMGPNHGMATAADTGKAYRGGNSLGLWLESMDKQFSSKYWNTFKNWEKLGIFPRKGEHGTWCQYCEKKRIKDRDNEDKDKDIFIWKCFVVFNAEQCYDKNAPAGEHGKLARFLCHGNDEHEKVSYKCVDDLIERHGITVKLGGDTAAWIPSLNYIKIPRKKHFKTPEDFYATLLHEVTHWAQGRNGRKGRGDDVEYANGELTAELGSMFLMRELGIPHGNSSQFENNAGYLRFWKNKLKEDNNYIFKASSEAAKLVDYLMGHGAEGATEKEASEEVEMATA